METLPSSDGFWRMLEFLPARRALDQPHVRRAGRHLYLGNDRIP
jgi:hypothetical protein